MVNESSLAVRRAARSWTLGLLAMLALAVLIDPRGDYGPSICVFKNATGLPCAGCGMTHAFAWLVRGDLARAMHANMLSPVVFALALWGLYRQAGVWSGVFAQAWPPVPPRIGLAACAVVVGWWGVRLYLGL